MDLPEVPASEYLSLAMVGFMVGRFTGTFFMKYISPARLLMIYSGICVILLLLASFISGPMAVYAVMAVPFFMSIMFPTIFALGLKDLGGMTKKGSSVIVMTIDFGALFPMLMGRIADVSGMATGFIVPLVCFAFIAWYAMFRAKSAQKN